jgi:glycerate-2-kinase
MAGGGVAALAGSHAVRRIFLVGGGKAGRTMGEAAVGILGGRTAAGVLAVPSGKGGSEGPVRFFEAGHPLPDGGSREAARAMLDLLSSAGESDLVVALISGGGSAMISAPPEGVSPEDKEDVLRRMLRSGADIGEFNTVRKHLSQVKGGRLGRAAFPARVFALLLSDVPGDDPSVIASGPFSPDPTTYGDAMEILVRRGIRGEIPASASAHLEAGAAGKVPETPKPDDPAFAGIACAVIGSNRLALEAASAAAGRAGADTVRLLPGFLRGEARECARSFVEEMRRTSRSLSLGRTAVLIAGGETTVTVRGGGRGGRNQEFALAAAIAMEGEEGMEILAAGTDGVDGPTDAAGAVADGSTCARARIAGRSAEDHLGDNDAYPFFRALSDLVVTGPTGTNVTDIAIGLIGFRRAGLTGFKNQ